MRGRSARLRSVVAGAVVLAVVVPAVSAGASHITAGALATAMARAPGQLGTSSFTATPTGEPYAILSSSVAGFPRNGSDFAVLTTGDGNAVTSPNDSDRTGTDLSGSDMRGALDVTILKVDLTVPSDVNCLSFDFRFFSEEFPEFVGSGLSNDGFVAELDGSTWTVTGSTLNAPNNFAVDQNDSVITVDGVGNSVSAGNAAGTTYDAATSLLTAQTGVTVGPHSLYLSIYDHADGLGDSAVFVDDLRLTSELPGSCGESGGGSGVADLSITKADSPDPVAAGATLTYTLSVTNDGPDPASAVTVTDPLPGSVTFGSASATQGNCTGTSTVTCSLGPMAFGATATVTIAVTPTVTGPLSNTASVSSSTSDPNASNDSATASTTVTTQAFALSVTVDGTGTGSVTSSPAGISCPSDCSENYADGTVVTLTPTPALGSVFAGWSGACTGTGTCNVTMNSAKSVAATFNVQSYTLSVSIGPTSTGSGTLTSSPAGISCPGDCSESYPSGTVVILTASAAPGSFFAGWSGACTGTGTCNVTMNAAKSVTATFFLEGQTFPLTVSVDGTGSGSVTSSPAGVSCPGDCVQDFSAGTVVDLTATPAAGSALSGWSGACTGTGSCTVTMNSANSVTATFGPAGSDGTATTKKVTLKASKKRVPPGTKVKLTVTVGPCGARAGQIVQLNAGKKVKQKTIDASCKAVFKWKIVKKTTFQALSPKQGDDQLTAVSNKVRVGLKLG